MKLRKAGKKPKYRWWQHLLRVAAVLALVLAGLYITLPWWAPTGMMSRWLEQRLSSQMGTPVTIGGLSLSWRDGVAIDSFCVANPGGFGDQPLLKIRAIRCDFSPLRTLARGSLEWMVVDSPALRVVADPKWDLNVAHLRFQPGGLGVDRISINQATSTLSLPNDPDRLRLDVANLQIQGGQLDQFGRLTMSASLTQPSASAPVALTALSGQAAGNNSKAVLKFSFGQLNIGELGLVQLLGLPLSRLQGLCDGQVQCRVNADGIVEDMSLDVSVHGLDVQPQGGPELPVIDQAGVHVAATYDFFNQIVNVRSLKLQAPGVDLDGQGSFHTTLLTAGQWMGGQSLHLKGQINPAAITALLTGRPEPLAGLVTVDGNVGLDVQYTQTADEQVQAKLAVDVSAATLVRDQTVLKPAGRAMMGTLSASCKLKTWKLAVGSADIQIGDNHFIGQGSLDNIRRVLTHQAQSDQPWTVTALEQDLAGLDWQGRWQITELDSLRQLNPALESALAGVALNGQIAGSWTLGHTGGAGPGSAAGTQLDVRVVCGEGTSLVARPWLDKPVGLPLELQLHARYGDSPPRFQEAMVRWVSGDGVVSLQMDQLRVGPFGPANRLEAMASGTFRAEKVEQVLRLVPALTPVAGQCSGSAGGKFLMQLGDSLMRVNASCDASPMSLTLPDQLDKRAGQPMTLTCNWLYDWSAHTNELDLSADLPGATLTGRLATSPDRWAGHARLNVADVTWLVSQIPALRSDRTGWRLGGAMHASAELSSDDRTLAGNFIVVGDDLEIRSDSPARYKQAGVPLRVSGLAQLGRPTEAGAMELELKNLAVDIGACSARLSGRMAIDQAGTLGQASLTGRVGASISPELLSFLPELREPISQYGLQGGLTARCQVDSEGLTFHAVGQVDATTLGVATELAPGGRFVKPVGMPGLVKFDATLPGDLSYAMVNHWRAQLGPVGAIGDARVDWVRSPEGLPVALAGAQSHVRLWTGKAQELTTLLPGLAEYSPTGEAEIEGEFKHDADGTRVTYANLRLSDLGLTFAQRPAALNGALLVEQIGLTRGEDPLTRARQWRVSQVGRLASDGLRWTVGSSSATLTMDVTDPLQAPAGQVAMAGREMDAQDLTQWVKQLSLPAGGTTTLPTATNPQPAGPLTQEMTAELVREADRKIASARQWSSRANLVVAVDVDHLRNWRDDKVNVLYDVSGLTLRATLQRGQAKAEIVAGANGGNVTQTYSLDLLSDAPRLSQVIELRDMLAGPNMQPQVEAFFPGNQLLGWMSRHVELQMPLRGVIVNAMDSRYPLYPQGEGVAQFHHGLTLGRAAPLFVTRLFPGLNLVEYQYDRMTSFSKFYPDGVAENDMLFSGRGYDLYISGRTGADQVGLYTIGVLLPAYPGTPDWKNRLVPARIPILKFKARIVDGKKVDETITYPWPYETLLGLIKQTGYRVGLSGPARP